MAEVISWITNLLDFSLKFGADDTVRDLLEKGSLGAGQMLTELQLPLGDLVHWDRVELQSTLSYSRIKQKNTLTRPLTPAKMIGT